MATRYLTDCLQNSDELHWFISLLNEEGCRSYLEIGSRWGGSFWRIANALPRGSRVVSVDMPAEPTSEASLRSCVAELKRKGYDAHLLIGNSQTPDVVRNVHGLGKFDACLIDGDHSLAGVTADWINYGPVLCRLVAFHDIAWWRSSEWKGTRIEVPGFWNEVKADYRHIERKLERKNNGIGVLWRS